MDKECFGHTTVIKNLIELVIKEMVYSITRMPGEMGGAAVLEVWGINFYLSLDLILP